MMKLILIKKNAVCIARTVIMLFFAALLIRAAPVRAGKCPSPEVNNGFIPVKIHQIAIDPNSSQ
ncbi:MAG: hypothetical protein JRJ85_23990, partial [Deltaproteobacteria bacterium]|nr:hypothetical protein [Deltaproteobacteria bacterium]